MATDNFLARNKITFHSVSAVAGSTDISPANGIDTAGFQGLVFIASYGVLTATAVTGLHLEQSSVIDGTGDAFTAVAGSSILIDDDEDNGLLAIELIGPAERFIRCVIDRATANAVFNGVIAIQYGGAKLPVTHDATVRDSEIHVDAIAGTA